MDRITEYLQDRPRDAIWLIDAVLAGVVVVITMVATVLGAWAIACLFLSGFGAP